MVESLTLGQCVSTNEFHSIDTGPGVETESVLRQAMAERIKPVLFMDNMDRVFQDEQLDKEDFYQSCARNIEDINVIINTHANEQGPMGKIMVNHIWAAVPRLFGSVNVIILTSFSTSLFVYLCISL